MLKIVFHARTGVLTYIDNVLFKKLRYKKTARRIQFWEGRDLTHLFFLYRWKEPNVMYVLHIAATVSSFRLVQLHSYTWASFRLCLCSFPGYSPMLRPIGGKRNRANENFKKRWRTFLKNGFRVQRDYHADVYILLRRNGQLYEFKSTGDAWPLSYEKVVSQHAYPAPIQFTAADMEGAKAGDWLSTCC